MEQEHISERVQRDQVVLYLIGGHYLSLLQVQAECSRFTEIALGYRNELVPLSTWLVLRDDHDPEDIYDDDYRVDPEFVVDVQRYHALGFASEAELVAHVMNEAIRYVTFIDVWRSGGDS